LPILPAWRLDRTYSTHTHYLYLLISFAKIFLGECSIDIHYCLVKNLYSISISPLCVMFPWTKYLKYIIDIPT
jgi:hypothetical protein